MSNVQIKDLTIKYGQKVVFDKFSIDFNENKINVILGDSGIGKTTLLNAIAGILPYEGTIDGVDGEISYIFQKDRLIPTISVFKNLDLILKTVYDSKQDRKEKIQEMLKILEIDDCENKLPTQLSGGQLQRVSIARAFLYPSKVLLLDEPFKALDTSLKIRIFKSFLKIYNDNPRTVIFVTHAIDECLLLADNYYVLSSKPIEVVLDGSIELDKNDRNITNDVLAQTRELLLKALFKR